MDRNKTVSRRMLVLLLAVVLLIGCAVGGTLAWLTAQSGPVTNTFAVGDIQLTLKEHELNPDGTWKDTFTSTGNSNILAIPGRTIGKDPTVTVLKGSEDCYVRVLFKVYWGVDADALFSQFAYHDWFDFDTTSWTITRIFDGSLATNGKYVGYDIYEFRYKSIVSAANGDVELPVFTKMTFPASLSNAQIQALEDCGITLIAQAIQSETFADAATAWKEVPLPEGYSSNVPPKENP